MRVTQTQRGYTIPASTSRHSKGATTLYTTTDVQIPARQNQHCKGAYDISTGKSTVNTNQHCPIVVYLIRVCLVWKISTNRRDLNQQLLSSSSAYNKSACVQSRQSLQQFRSQPTSSSASRVQYKSLKQYNRFQPKSVQYTLIQYKSVSET